MDYPESASGYWKVKLSKVFPHRGFTYKPSHDVTADEDTLKVMIAAKAVASVTAA